MALVIIDGVIANDAFATPATPNTFVLQDGLEHSQFATGASATSQPVDVVLGLTTWSAGAVSNSQALAITLDDVVVAVSQSKATSNSQALAITLDDVTVAVAQTAVHSQALAITLDSVTSSITQALSHSQAMAVTLDSITASVTQTAGHPQSLAITLDDVVIAISQSATSAGNSQTLAIVLDDVTCNITQALSRDQILSATLDDIIVSISQAGSNVVPIKVGGDEAGEWKKEKPRKKKNLAEEAQVRKQSILEAYQGLLEPITNTDIAIEVNNVIQSSSLEEITSDLNRVKALLALWKLELDSREQDDEEALLMLL